jgi:endonuclease/exonuclease/phosphatase family metal-dependent hydrolase
MKVMTFNLRYDNTTDGYNQWSLRKEALLKMFHKQDADVIGTQECTQTILDYLQEHLSEYDFVGDGREADLSGERCAILFKKASYELLETQTVWLNGDFTLAGDLDKREGFARICTMALLLDQQTGQKIRIFNAHLAYKSKSTIRRNGRMLYHYIQQFKKTKIPFVLMGDFNSPISHPLHTRLLRSFKEAYTELNLERPNTFHAFGVPNGIEAIDFIYTKSLKFKSIITDTSLIEGHYPSDHYPVIAELL